MTASTARPSYPFSALVGHEDLRLALLLNAVHPGIGGVLVRGEKGTAKSTAVRALAALLPPVATVEACRFSCDPGAPDPTCPDGPHRTGQGATAAASAGRTPPPAKHPAERAQQLGDPAARPAEPPPPVMSASPRSAEHRRPARLVELPVGATEDRLVGSLDLERALAEGVRAYQPGLLAEAHRGVLYVDEVNLLPDHLVDLLLDAAAMGRAHVERDGVSVSHAASFLLVGTMNPEEGELRPQLLDRFGLTVQVRASRVVDERVEVVRRRLAFDDDAAGFCADWAGAEAGLAARIADARARLAAVRLGDGELRRIAAVCAAFDVDGMRADLVIARAALAHAAWRGAGAVEEQDVRVAARLALPHRRRRDPFDEPGLDEQALEDALRDAASDCSPDASPPDANSPKDNPADGHPDDGSRLDGRAHADTGGAGRSDSSGGGPEDDGPDDGPGGGGPSDPDAGPDPELSSTNGTPGRSVSENALSDGGSRATGDGTARPVAGPSEPFRARLLDVPGLGEGAPGRRSRARTDAGRVIRPTGTSPRRAADLHLPATVTAAAPQQRARGRSGPGLRLQHDDLRGAEREGREGNLVLFAVDASGSMAARARMSAVTGAVLALLRDAYQRRDRVGLVTFRAGAAEVALPPTSSVPAARARLAALHTGGRTPLAAGLLRARQVLTIERLRDPRRRPLLVLLTDGRATVAVAPGGDPVADACRAAALLAADGVAGVVVDCESGPVRLGLAARVAAAAGAALVTVEELSADRVTGVVHAARSTSRPRPAA